MRLSDVTSVNEMNELVASLNKIHYLTTHGLTTSSASANERQLLHVIDYLVRVPNMLAGMIEEDLSGEIITQKPMDYVHSKLSTSANALDGYLKMKHITIEQSV